jgi:hypothetical protein
MGIYYAVACDERKELITPMQLGSAKYPAISARTHPLGPLVLFAMGGLWDRLQVRLVDDCCDEGQAYDEYRDITEEVAALYNKSMAPASTVEFKP